MAVINAVEKRVYNPAHSLAVGVCTGTYHSESTRGLTTTTEYTAGLWEFLIWSYADMHRLLEHIDHQT